MSQAASGRKLGQRGSTTERAPTTKETHEPAERSAFALMTRWRTASTACRRPSSGSSARFRSPWTSPLEQSREDPHVIDAHEEEGRPTGYLDRAPPRPERREPHDGSGEDSGEQERQRPPNPERQEGKESVRRPGLRRRHGEYEEERGSGRAEAEHEAVRERPGDARPSQPLELVGPEARAQERDPRRGGRT